MTKLFLLFKTIISLISIYLLIVFKIKHKKIIMFYFPVKIYQDNLFDVINVLKKRNDILLIYNDASKKEIEQHKNSFFVDFDLLKFIPFNNFFLRDINIFLTSYVAYVFPPNSKNIYISHDIYDAPMVNKSLEKKIFLRINKLDYIFLSSKISSQYFKAQFKKYKIPSKTKLINTGYLKLDNIKKKLGKNKNKNKKILIAPGYSYAFKKYNMYQHLEKIIENLLSKTNEKIIYRPHPLDLTNKGDLKTINKILYKFKKNHNFSFDLSVSYFNSFKNSKLLITDLSSTAFTYAFATEQPVIFFSKNENRLKSDYFSKLYYFKDRKKIGAVVENVSKLLNIIRKNSLNKVHIYNNIIRLRKNRIEFFGSAVKRTAKEINKINQH